ncbi:MAG: hypothetical protein OEY29_09635 [Gammaproteobacteria bacterium]|nr:hypothetical protein [Gammaproteobacteria bacterium]
MRLFTIFLLLLTFNVQAEFYKKINPDGSVSYSDTETPGSEAITPPQITPSPAIKYNKKIPDDTSSVDGKALPYQSISITSPEDQAVIRGNNGNVTVSLSIQPALQTAFSHSINIFVDGKVIKTGITTSSILLNDLDRGGHTITAQIVDLKKKLLKSSQSITVHIKRHSILQIKPTDPYKLTNLSE